VRILYGERGIGKTHKMIIRMVNFLLINPKSNCLYIAQGNYFNNILPKINLNWKFNQPKGVYLFEDNGSEIHLYSKSPIIKYDFVVIDPYYPSIDISTIRESLNPKREFWLIQSEPIQQIDIAHWGENGPAQL